MRRLFIDTETRSTIPLKHGVKKYSLGVELLTIQWSIDGGIPYLWDAYSNPEPPEELVNALNVATEVWAAGAEFDRTVLETLPWYNKLCRVPLERWRCLQALARLHGLPGGLDKLSKIFNLGVEGKKEGKELIRFFCVPRKGDGQYNRPEDHRTKWADFLLYAVWDVPSMYDVWRKIPKWNSVPKEWALYHADQRMNDRGVQFDIELAKAVIVATEKEKTRLKKRTAELTATEAHPEGAVQSATQRDRLLDYLLAELDIALPDLRADTIERRLADDNIPEVIKELLRVRLMASKSSVTKYKRVVECEVNGRLHNLITFRGAQRTGRMSGRTFQPQNLARTPLKRAEIEVLISAFKSGDIMLLTDDVNKAAADCLRGLIIAKPGYKLVASDLANIEGRMLAWLAGEDWKLQAYIDYDAGEGADLYCVAYGRSFGVDPLTIEKESPERQIGKVEELALGYYGGVGAFASMAATQKIDLDEMAEACWPTLPEKMRAEGPSRYDKALKRKRTYDMAQKTFMACDALVRMWREAHPATKQYWPDVEDAVRAAIAAPERVFRVRNIHVDRKGAWLRIRLPSGRYLCYPSPQIAESDEYNNGTIRFLGVDPYTRQWAKIKTYSGKVVENIDQASSADQMTDGMVDAEAEGYPPVLTVHDELICEVPDNAEHTAVELSAILARTRGWNDGLPLTAKGHEMYRYGK